MILYLLQTLIISAILSLSYGFFFRSSTQFRLRRIFILSIPVLSLMIPFADKIKWLNNPKVQSLPVTQMLAEVNIDGAANALSTSSFSVLELSLWVYLLMSLFLLFKLGKQILSVSKLKKNAEYKEGVYYLNHGQQAFSFLNDIFVPKALYQDCNLIIEHEKVHVEQKHSYDVLFLELMKIIFWLNPFYYLLKKEISEVHEFLVDETLLKKDTDVEQYCELLMQNGNLKYMAIGNHFNRSLTKIRFIMMTKKRKSTWLPIKILAMLTLVFGLSLTFNNCKILTKKTSQSEDARLYELNEVDVMPEFPGGMLAVSQFLGENTKYPEEAKKNGVQGKVFASFVVSKTGKVINPKIERGINTKPIPKSKRKLAKLLDDEALRVVSTIPDWKPAEHKGKKVSVSFIVPIIFNLD